eukprot:5484914-Prymnesium_polylepis.2
MHATTTTTMRRPHRRRSASPYVRPILRDLLRPGVLGSMRAVFCHGGSCHGETQLSATCVAVRT